VGFVVALAVQVVALVSKPVPVPVTVVHDMHTPLRRTKPELHDVTVTVVALLAVQLAALVSAPVLPEVHERHVLGLAPPGAQKAYAPVHDNT